MKEILAWHFLDETGTLRFNDGRKPKIGEVIYSRGPLSLCDNGMHASKNIIEALRYSPGPILCRVKMHGEVLIGDDKLCAEGREVLAMANVTRDLHLFAISCARRALKIAKVTDNRCWNALRVKRKWLDGKATNQELAAALDAAWAAAWDAARDAAWAAAWDTARAAAWDAAWAAARAAERAAARAAERDTAWAAEQKWQTKKLREIIRKSHPELFSF